MQEPEGWTKSVLDNSTFCGDNTAVLSAKISLEVEFIGRSGEHEQLSVALFKSVSLTPFQVVPPCSAPLGVHPSSLFVCFSILATLL